MGSTKPSDLLALLGHARAASPHSTPRSGGGIGEILRSIEGTVGALSHTLGGVFEGVGGAGLANSLTKALLGGFFRGLLNWVAAGAASLVGVLGKALSESTEPVITGAAFRSEFEVMAVLSASVALPLLAVGAIQAIVRQEAGTLLRSALVKLPLALLFTAVSVQLVVLGLAATDQASALVLGAAGDPTRRLLLGLVTELGRTGGLGLAAFGSFLVVLAAALVAFLLWLELAVRSAAIAAASLFLPLALVGVAWPATSHWARRLGETLAALVLSKLVIAAVLALAAGLLGSSEGVAGVVEGVGLLAVSAFAPFALLKLVPAIEAGAVAHLEGLGRRPVRAAHQLGTAMAGMELGASLGSFGGPGLPADGSGLRTTGAPFEGPWTTDRSRPGATLAGESDDSRPPSGSGDSAPESRSVKPAGPSHSNASAQNLGSADGLASSRISEDAVGPGAGPESTDDAVAGWGRLSAQGDADSD